MEKKLQSLLGCKTRRMTEDESKLLLHLLMLDMHKKGDAILKIDDDLREREVFVYLVLSKRLEGFNTISPKLEVDTAVQIMCTMLCDTPGKAVIWAYTLNELFVKLGHEVAMDDWVNEFPDGVPMEEEYQRVWEAQKSGGANMIDDFKNWSLPK